MKAFADDKWIAAKMIIFVFDRVKTLWEKEKMPMSSIFFVIITPTMTGRIMGWPMTYRRAVGFQFFVRSMTLSSYVRLTWNLACVFVVTIRSALHKNHNFTSCCLWIISRWSSFLQHFLLVRSIILSSHVRLTWKLLVSLLHNAECNA